MIKAVIFDMDGVLIDSEIVYLEHILKKLAVTHPKISREALLPIVGSTSRVTREIVFEAAGEPLDSEEFGREYDSLWEDCHVNYPSIMRKEAPGLLEELGRRGYKRALASSTAMAGIDAVLTSCELKKYFHYVVSGEMFKESKPNPEIYLHTAETLGCSPSDCLVIEDSTYGITAGHRAGMTVAALIDDRFGFDRSLADYSVGSLMEVLSVLEQIGEGV